MLTFTGLLIFGRIYGLGRRWKGIFVLIDLERNVKSNPDEISYYGPCSHV